MRRAAVGLATLLLLLTAGPASAEHGFVNLSSVSSGVSLHITDHALVDSLANLTQGLPAVEQWSDVTPESGIAASHQLSIYVEQDPVDITSTKYYSQGDGRHPGALLSSDKTKFFFVGSDVEAQLQPYLDRLSALEGDVAFARTLQIIAGVALAALVCALFAIGMREERRPQVLR